MGPSQAHEDVPVMGDTDIGRRRRRVPIALTTFVGRELGAG
jgi:hypothetical protein